MDEDFQRLLEQAHLHGSHLSQPPGDLACDVFGLDSMNFDALMMERLPHCEVPNLESCEATSISVCKLIQKICSSHLFRMKQQSLAAVVLARLVKSFLKNGVKILNMQEVIKNYARLVGDVNAHLGMSKRIFQDNLAELLLVQLQPHHVEAVVLLCGHGLLDMKSFLKCVVEKGKEENLICCAKMFFGDSVAEVAETMLQQLFDVAYGQSVHRDEASKLALRTLLELLQGCTFPAHGSVCFGSGCGSGHLLQLIKQSCVISERMKSMFVLDALSRFLSGTSPIADILKIYEDVSCNKLGLIRCARGKVNVSDLVGMAMCFDDVLQLLYTALREREINWSFMILVLQGMHRDETSKADSMIKKIWMDAFQLCEGDLLLAAILLKRTSLPESSNLQDLYQKWLQSMLKASTEFFTSKQLLTFFLENLVKIVPFERSPFLKAQLIVLPDVPASLRALLDDYTILAKSKLRDLKIREPLSLAVCKITDESKADVSKAASEFRRTGVLTNYVVETSIFKKAYFMASFVPTLVQLAIDEGDVYSGMLKKLQKAGKLPDNIFQQYEILKEEEMLKNKASETGSVVTAIAELLIASLDSFSMKAAGCVSSLDRLQELCKQRINALSRQLLKLTECCKDLESSLSSSLEKVPYSFLNAFCKVVSSVGNSEESSSGRYYFMKQFVKLILFHPDWHERVFEAALALLLDKGTDLKDFHISGLACYAWAVDACARKSLAVAYNEVLLADIVCCKVSVSNSLLALRWLCEYLSCGLQTGLGILVVTHGDEIIDGLFCISRKTLSLFQALRLRVQYLSEVYSHPWYQFNYSADGTLDAASRVERNSEFSIALADNKISLRDWLHFEMRSEEALSLPLRLSYFQDIIVSQLNCSEIQLLDAIVEAILENRDLNPESPSFASVIILLQTAFLSTESPSAQGSLLTRVMDHVMKNDVDGRVLYNAVSVMLSLPRHALRHGDIHGMKEDIVSVKKFILLVSDKLADESSILPVHITSWIVQLFAPPYRTKAIKNLDDAWNKEQVDLLANCAVFALSVLAHLPKLESVLATWRSQIVLDQLKLCRNIVDRGSVSELRGRSLPVVSDDVLARFLVYTWRVAWDKTDKRSKLEKGVLMFDRQVLTSVCSTLISVISSTRCYKDLSNSESAAMCDFLKSILRREPAILRALETDFFDLVAL